ncbi:MAG: ABC transporter substrate-binding protein [Proteobacteria bacterium]|nr:ABC transporter substrate-binding protein [Pseudomonadota bacterium]
MELRDAAGTLHAPAQGPARIVCLVPSITELVCDLGLAPQLVGRTGFCIHPKAAVRSIPKVGGTKAVDLGRIRELRPTHVILNIDENEKPVAEALAEFVPHLVVTHPQSPLDNLGLYRLVGGIFGRAREAEALCARFQSAYDILAAEAPAKLGTLYLIWKDPWMTVSRDTYLSRTLALAGFETLPERAKSRYPEISLDEPWVAQADLVLLSSEPYMFRKKHLAPLAALPALAGKAVRLVDGEMASWYGSRAIAGLAYLRELRRSVA